LDGKEVLYAAEENFLERYLREKASATLDDMKAISDLWGNPIHKAGSDAAVDEIYSVENDTACITIAGPLSPEGPDLWDRFWGYGGTSYATIIAAMERAKNDDMVKRVIFYIDSPGGTVAGADETWQAHKRLASKKHTSVHAGNMLASAAYYISAPAKKIMACTPLSKIGSIGIVVAAYDWSKWEEGVGIRRIVITSSNAPDKCPDIGTRKGQNTIKAQLDAIERVFYARVSEGRRVTTEHIAGHFGYGGILIASDPSPEHEDAIRAGMIDGLLFGSTPAPIASTSPESTPEQVSSPPSGGNNNPAQAGINQEGQSTMDLSEFLKANPAAAAEIEKIKADAMEAGRAKAGAEFSAKVDRMIGVITSTSYPDNIKALAGDVLAGKKGIDAFDAAVAVFDAQKEAAASQGAKEETGSLGSVSANSPDGKSAGEKELDAAIKAEMETRRAG